VARRVWGEPAACLLELARAPVAVAAPGLIPGDCDVHEALEKVTFLRRRGAPGCLEFLVRLEISSTADEGEAFFIAGHDGMFAPMATILLVGVDLFFRGKLDVLLAGHHLVTADTLAEPELVLADISRVEPEDVADAYPDIPIVGFSSHTDTGGLRRAHAAGFDQVLAKSALQERCAAVVEELLAPVE
jgi:CheY-like chemotaxis protein